MLKFGDYVQIEQKRYGVKNELYTYKVIGTKRSNAWTEVPVIAGESPKLQKEMVDCVYCICCGVMEDTVETFRVEDVKQVLLDLP